MFIEVLYYHSAKSSISGSQNLMYTTIVPRKLKDKDLQQKAMNRMSLGCYWKENRQLKVATSPLQFEEISKKRVELSTL